MTVLSQMRPVDEREFARVLAEAAASRTPLEVSGSGSKQKIGRPMQTAANISARAMRGVTLYEPSEMVMAARAGTPLKQIESDLADRGQMLAFEPIELGRLVGGEQGQATIGGVFATNFSGARRISVGAARDHLLGVRGINGRGEIFKSGGRVMKNVTGYDLCRGLSGSWGTLAVLSEVTFKVLPIPEDTGTVVLLGLPDEFAVEVMCTAMASPFEVSGAVHLHPALVARLEHPGLRNAGAGPSRRSGSRTSRSRWPTARPSSRTCSRRTASSTSSTGDNSLSFWDELRRLSLLQGSEAPLWRISTAPTAAPKVVAAISAYMECRAFYDWSGGLVWAEVLPTTDAGAADVRRVIATHGGHATLIRAEPVVRAAVEVFQPLEAGVEKLSRKLKATFDPAGILNPGRMYPGF